MVRASAINSQGGGLDRWVHEQEIGRDPCHRHRLEIFQQVIAGISKKRRIDRHRDAVKQECVTIGRSRLHLLRSDVPTRTRFVLNHHGLAKRSTHRFGEHARNNVGG